MEAGVLECFGSCSWPNFLARSDNLDRPIRTHARDRFRMCPVGLDSMSYYDKLLEYSVEDRCDPVIMRFHHSGRVLSLMQRPSFELIFAKWKFLEKLVLVRTQRHPAAGSIYTVYIENIHEPSI